MSVDQPRRDKTTLGINLFVHGLRIFLANELYMSAVEYDDTIFDKFMFLAVEANDITPLDHGSHIQIPSIWIVVTGRTNKRSLLRQAGSDPRWQSLKGDRRQETQEIQRPDPGGSPPHKSFRKPLFSNVWKTKKSVSVLQSTSCAVSRYPIASFSENWSYEILIRDNSRLQRRILVYFGPPLNHRSG
jgi:hypothetical protein